MCSSNRCINPDILNFLWNHWLSSMYENQDSSLNKNWELQFSFKTSETWGLIPFQINVRMRFIQGGKRITFHLSKGKIYQIKKIVFLFSTWRKWSPLPSVVKISKPQVQLIYLPSSRSHEAFQQVALMLCSVPNGTQPGNCCFQHVTP